MKTIFRWLRPLHVQDDYERFVYTSLHYGLQFGFLLTLVFLLAQKYVDQVIIIAGFAVCTVVSYILLQKRRLYLAGGIFLTGGWLLVSFALVRVNGVYNVALNVYVIFIILSNVVFVRRRVVLAVTTVSILYVVALSIAQNQGVLPQIERPVPIINRTLVAIIVFGVTGIVSAFASSSLRKTLARVKHSEERYRLLFDNATTMAMVYDIDGNVILANDAAAKVIGKTRVEVEGHSIDDLVTPDNAAEIMKMNQKALETGKVMEFENIVTSSRSGSTVSYLRHIVPLPGSDGPQIMVLTTDLTEHQRHLKRQQELQAAQEKITFYTEFFGTISHDLKTPLSVMNTGLYLLERAETPEGQKQKITQLQQQISLLEHYIQDMLLISQLEQAPVLERESVDLDNLTADIVQSLQPKIEEKQLQCTMRCPDQHTTIRADRGQIRRALTNLVENAVNYTSDGGKVSVSILQKSDTVSIEVSDTGIGIQPEDEPHIFDAFYRAAEAKAKISGGSGLGLAIVKRVVDLHEGSISLESRPQQGSCFTLTLPVR